MRLSVCACQYVLVSMRLTDAYFIVFPREPPIAANPIDFRSTGIFLPVR
jgi:hypothetical protein